MHVLFGGTKLLQSTGDKSTKIRTPDGGCLAVVLRTGFGTAQGGWSWGHVACELPCWAGNVQSGQWRWKACKRVHVQPAELIASC